MPDDRRRDRAREVEAIYDRLGGAVHAFALREFGFDDERAEDVRQAWAERVLLAIDTVEDPSRVDSFCWTIVRNLIIDERRRATNRHPHVSDAALDERPAMPASRLRTTLRLWWSKESATLEEVDRALVIYGACVEDAELTWAEAALHLNERFGRSLGMDAWRKRWKSLRERLERKARAVR